MVLGKGHKLVLKQQQQEFGKIMLTYPELFLQLLLKNVN